VADDIAEKLLKVALNTINQIKSNLLWQGHMATCRNLVEWIVEYCTWELIVID
jgi:hypothetical protein